MTIDTAHELGLDRSLDERLIADALRASQHDVRRAGRGRWDLALVNGTVRSGVALARDGWLSLEFPAEITDRWSMLRCNATLGAGVKIAIDAADGGALLIGELAMECVPQRIGSLWDALQSAADSIGGEDHDAAPIEAATRDPDRTAALAELCGRTSWAWRPGDEGEIAVELESPRHPCSARIVARTDGSIAAGAAIVNGDAPPSPPCRDALATLLAIAGGSIRLARAAVVEAPAAAGHQVRIETLLSADADAAALSRALESLSVMCDACGPEAVLLHDDEPVARRCLRVWEGSTVAAPASLASRSRSTLFEGV